MHSAGLAGNSEDVHLEAVTRCNSQACDADSMHRRHVYVLKIVGLAECALQSANLSTCVLWNQCTFYDVHRRLSENVKELRK